MLAWLETFASPDADVTYKFEPFYVRELSFVKVRPSASSKRPGITHVVHYSKVKVHRLHYPLSIFMGHGKGVQ